jgi:hypothetical protein
LCFSCIFFALVAHWQPRILVALQIAHLQPRCFLFALQIAHLQPRCFLFALQLPTNNRTVFYNESLADE